MEHRCVKQRRVVNAAIVAAAGMVALPAAAAWAVNKTYVGPASGIGANWNNAANWSPAGLPGSGDAALIVNNDTTNRTVTLDVTAPLNALLIGNSGGGTNTLIQSGAFNLSGDGERLGLNPGDRAVHTQSAGNNSYYYSLSVGYSLNSLCTYNLAGGSITLAGPSSVFYLGVGGGTGNFNHTGGTFTIGPTSGSTIALLGESAGSVGNYNLSNAGSSLIVNGAEYIGVAGTATFTQSGGTHTVGSVASPRELIIANSAGSSGTLAVSGGAMTVNGNAYVGGSATAAGGTGALNITGGTMTTTGTLKVYKNGTSPEPGVKLTGGTLNAGTLLVSSGKVALLGGTLNVGAIRLENFSPGLTAGGQLELGPGMTIATPLIFGHQSTLRGDVNSRYTGTITGEATGGSLWLDSGSNPSTVLRIDGMPNQCIGGTACTMVVAGAGTVSMPFSNDSFQGGWNLNQGTLSIGHASSMGTGTEPVYIFDGALQINNLTLTRDIELFNGSTLRGTGTSASVGTMLLQDDTTVTFATGTNAADVLTIGDRYDDLTQNYQPGDTYSVHVTGSGTVRVPFYNRARAIAWTVDSGTLSVGYGGALGTESDGCSVTVNSGATLELTTGLILKPMLHTGATLRGIETSPAQRGATVAFGAAVTLATGTSASDNLIMRPVDGGGGGSTVTIGGSGTVSLTMTNSYTGNWTLASGTLDIDADDRLGNLANTVAFNGGTLLTSGAVTSARAISVNTGGGTFDTNSFNSTFSGSITGPGDLTKNGAGTLALTGTHSYSGGTIVNAGMLHVKTLHPNNAVTLNGGTLKVLESAPGVADGHPAGNNAFVSRPSSLSISGGGTLDLTNNDLILDYSGSSPVAAYEALVASGYNVTGDWQGAGITSSVAANDGNYVLAIADNAALAAPFGTAQGGPLFAGVDVDLDTILIKFTHRADINLDGVITPDDSAIFGGNYDENQPAVWATGDMNYDGVCTPDDAAIFGGAYDESLASLPEPAAASALLVLTALATRRRRR